MPARHARELALQQMRNATGELDDLEAPLHGTPGVGQRLAVLGGDDARHVSAFCSRSALNRKGAGALQRRRVGPGRKGRFAAGDGGIDQGRASTRQRGRHLPRRRIEDLRVAAARRRQPAADPVDGICAGSPSAVAAPSSAAWCSVQSIALAARRRSVSISSSISVFCDDQRRRQRDDVAGGADQRRRARSLRGTPRRRAWSASPAIGSSSMAPIRPMLRMSMTCGLALQRMQRVLPIARRARRRASSSPSSL